MFDRTEQGMWWDAGINVVWGCTPVSKGCTHCWSAQMTHNFQKHPGLTENVNGNIRFTGKILLTPIEKIAKRFSRKKPTAFAIWNDLFHPKVIKLDTADVMRVISDCPQHIFQILTKRPENAKKFFELWDKPIPDNVWFGVTAENQKRLDERVPILLKIPAAVRFGSLEPLLERIDLTWRFFKEDDYNFTGKFRTHEGRRQVQATIKAGTKPMIDWVIVGPETGPGRRPCELAWIELIVEQCAAAGVPCFVKAIPLDGGISKNMDDWPPEVRVRQYPEV